MDACKLVDEINIHHNQDVGSSGSSSSVCSIKPRRTVFKVASTKKAVMKNQRKSSSKSCPPKCYYKVASTSPTSSDLSMPCHAIFIFLDPLLLGVLQVEYQNKKESPLHTNPIQMQTFLVAICIYSMVLGMTQQSPPPSAAAGFLGFVILVSGSVSSGALFSILLHGLLLWIVLIILGSMPLVLCRHLIKHSANWVLMNFLVVKKFDLIKGELFHYWKKPQGTNIDHTGDVI